MKIIKYPVRIRGEDYTAEVRFCQCEDGVIQRAAQNGPEAGILLPEAGTDRSVYPGGGR